MKIPFITALILSLTVAACAKYHYQPESLAPEGGVSAMLARDIHDPGFLQFLKAHNSTAASRLPASWDFNQLTMVALYFNPGLRIAYAELDLRRAEEVTAGQRINPKLDLPLEYHSDTASGQSPLLVGGSVELVYERRAKREARLERALALSAAARNRVEAQAWSLRGELLGAYIDYYAAVKNREFIQQEHELLTLSQDLLQRRFELGQASGFEASTTRLQQQQLGLQLANQTAVINDARFSLAAALGLPVESLDKMAFSYTEMQNLPGPTAVTTLTIRELALINRYDMKQALSEYRAVEQALKFEIEKQYPDINLSPGFIFDQSDKIWALGSTWLLPVFHRNEGPILEAVARRRIKQAEFLALQMNIINDIARSRENYLTLNTTLNEAQSLISQLQGHYAKIKRQYELGYSDQLDLVRADIELLHAKKSAFAIRIETLKALQQLESAVQHPLNGDFDISGVVWQLFEQSRAKKNPETKNTNNE